MSYETEGKCKYEEKRKDKQKDKRKEKRMREMMNGRSKNRRKEERKKGIKRLKVRENKMERERNDIERITDALLFDML